MLRDIFATIIIGTGEVVERLMGFSYADILDTTTDSVNNFPLVPSLKFIAFLASVIFGSLFIYVFVSFIRFSKTKSKVAQTAVSPVIGPSPGLGMRWAEVLNHLESAREGEWKFAIIEADKLVDDALRACGFSGDTMGERLMAIDSTHLTTLEGLWQAHKVRNRLAHDSHYFLRHAEARQAVRLYEETLRELGAI